MPKTNAVRLLEDSSIPHSVIEYDSKDNAIDAVSVAHKIDADPESVFKTLVAKGNSNGINVFVIPGPYELDLKKAANISGNKSVELIKVKDILPITGYIRGGCSPLGMKKQFPTYIDETAQIFNKIYISAGIRGMQIKICPPDLLKTTNAVYSDLIR